MEISSDFLSSIKATTQTITSRQKEMAPKQGELVVQCVLDTYVGLTDQNKTYNRETPPKEVKAYSKDKKQNWNKAIDMYVKLSSMIQVEDLTRAVVDEKTGKTTYQVRVEANYWDDKTKNYLKEKAAHAWTHEDPESKRLRQFVAEDGTLASHYWRDFQEGDTVKASAPDRANNLLRQKVSPQSTIYKVQPGAPLRLYHVLPVSYIQVRMEAAKEEASDATATTEGGTSVAATDAEEGGLGEALVAPPKRLEERLSVSFKFNCKGYVTLDEENYDANMERSERMHVAQNKDVHNLVPIEKLREDRNSLSKRAYFYVSAGYQTRFNGDPKQLGSCIIREKPADDATHLPLPNFVKSKDGEADQGRFKATATVFQYVGKHNPETWDMYSVQFVSNDKTDTDWRKWGITDPHRYGCILSANRQIPIHIEAEPWTQSILDNLANASETIRDKPELARMQGYYTYGIKNYVPDFLRFFKTKGIKVSPEWVENDFAASESVNKKTGKRSITLRPQRPEKKNPVNSGGLQGGVLALGNGHMMTSDMTGEEFAVNHAWDGNLLTVTEAGTHDFYVLLSHAMTPEEEQLYARGEHGDFADEWVTSLTAGGDTGVYYWVYAVRKDAKMARDFLERNKPVVAKKKVREDVETHRPSTPLKREREEGESESDSATPSRRSQRQNIKQMKD